VTLDLLDDRSYNYPMATTIERRVEQLGMSFGAAANRLKKMIMYQMAGQLGRLTCFRCGTHIATVDEFSVDHKESWLDENADLFWSLENVAFSHLACNSGHKRHTVQKVGCGTHTKYSKHGCRCTACTEANRRHQSRYRERRATRLPPPKAGPSD